MSRDNHSLRRLTRAAILGTSIAAVPLTLAGCAEYHEGYGSPDDYAAAGSDSELEGLPARERRLCAEAMSSGDAQSAERVLRTYPSSRCVPGLLAALPPQTLSRISPQALAGVPARVRSEIPSQTAAHLRFPREADADADADAEPAPRPEPEPEPELPVGY